MFNKQKMLFIAAFYTIDIVVILTLFLMIYFALFGLLLFQIVPAGFWEWTFALFLALFAVAWLETRKRVARYLRARFFEKDEKPEE